MDRIFLAEETFKNNNNISVKNLSHWNSSDAFKKHMSQALMLPNRALPWDYSYTYSIASHERKSVLLNLGVPTNQINSAMCLLLQSSTIAIVNMINFLVQHKKKKLCILQPSYFSVTACCKMFSLDYDIEYINFFEHIPTIPIHNILSKGYDCIWITSPIYSTSCYFNESQIEEINKLKMLGITIILDESLALQGKELIRNISIENNVFAIYSPHKAISINGLKFSVIVCSNEYEDFFDQWVDIFSGSLSCSNLDAIFHYISSNYLQCCLPAYISYIKKSKAAVSDIVKRYPSNYILENTHGHYLSVFTKLKINNDDDIYTFVCEIIEKCRVSFLPGSINGFDDSNGLSFRINLTSDISELSESFERVLTYIDDNY